MLTLTNISKTYNIGKQNPVQALKNIFLNISSGELVAIVGKSGAGKSTLMHILACAENFEKGNYFFHGVSVTEKSDTEKAKIRNHKIGTVFQDFALVNDFSVFENVELPLYFCRNTKKQRQNAVTEALKIVGITELRHRNVTTLSGGQKQRVAIARAIVNNPDIILADEPTGALDTKTGVDIFNLLKSLSENGKTVIIITHDKDIAEQCTRVIEISDGYIISDVSKIQFDKNK